MVFKLSLEMSSYLDIDKSKKAKWEHILEHLSDFPVQEMEGKKVFRYTEKGMSWYPNNTLGIQHIYPAGQIHKGSDPALFEIAYNTVDIMQRWLDWNGANSFFPAAVIVGYDPVIILSKLVDYSKHTYPNGYQLNNPHGIENCSTVPNTVNMMLCSAHTGILEIFPLWPKTEDALFKNIRVHGAFLVSAKQKSGEVKELQIYSEQGRICILENPWLGRKVRITSDINSEREMEGKLLTIETQKGETLRILPL